MRIGIVGTIWMNTPPLMYGGTEEVIYNLANGLVEKGHNVTLFAPETTQTKAHLSPTVTLPLREKNVGWNDISYHLYHITQAFDRSNDFDILHVHLNKNQDYMTLPLASFSKTPVLTTLHFALPHKKQQPDRYQLLLKYKDLPFTSISTSQQHGMPLNFIETVYNSLNIQQYPFSAKPDMYVLWLGKIIPHKGTKEAILAAKKAGIPIKIAGVVDEGVEQSQKYFENEIQPLIDNESVTYLGPVGLPEKAKLLGKAQALLSPILWEEPFGLVMAEAQAVGTPVIAFNRGAANEVIQDNITGFLVENVDEMAEKILHIKNLQREKSREFIEERFSISNMIESYEIAYKATIEHWQTYMLKFQQTRERYKDKPAKIC